MLNKNVLLTLFGYVFLFISIVSTVKAEQIIPVTPENSIHYEDDEYIFCNMACASGFAKKNDTLSDYLEKLNNLNLPYRIVISSEQETTLYFSDFMFLEIIGNPIKKLSMNIATESSILSIPLRIDYDDIEDLSATIMDSPKARIIEPTIIISTLRNKWADKLKETVSAPSRDRLLCAMLEASTVYPGMRYVDYLQIQNEKLFDSTMIYCSTDEMWLAHDCFAGDMSIDFSFYFSNEILTCVIVTVFPPKTFFFDTLQTQGTLMAPTFVIDINETWIVDYLTE